MPKFALKYPYFIIMACLVIIGGITSIAGMPVDLFPKIDMPVVVVATFYSGMPPRRLKPISPIPSSASSPWAATSITPNRVR